MLKDLLGSNTTEKVEALFNYLFRCIDKYEFRAVLGKPEAKILWEKAKNNGYILKNCKLYLYALHKNMAWTPKHFKIEGADVRYLSNISFKKLSGCKPYSLEAFDELETSIMLSTQLSDYIGKFINRKMRFLIKTYGIGYDDIFSHLQTSALYALRKQYPYYVSELHALNICKASIHNAGQGLIEFHTRKRRQALISSTTGFQAVNIPYESLAEVGVGPDHDNPFRASIQGLVKVSESLHKRERLYLHVLAGLYDPGFSVFLGNNNSDVVDTWAYPRYKEQAMTYLSFSSDQEQHLFRQLRNKI